MWDAENVVVVAVGEDYGVGDRVGWVQLAREEGREVCFCLVPGGLGAAACVGDED